MNIIIAGAGEVGTHLAKLLSTENHNIVLIDQDKQKIQQASAFDIMTIEGSSSSPQTLLDADVKHADLFIAVTPEEAVNITSCMVASGMGAKKTIARIDNDEYLQPQNEQVFQKLGIDVMFYPEMLAAKEIVNALKCPWARLWFDIGNGEMVIAGVKIRGNAPIAGKYLHELGNDHKKFHVVAIKRNFHTIIPNGSTQIQANDLVFFSATREYIEEIPKIAGKRVAQVKDVMIMGGSRIAVRTCQYLPRQMHVKLIEPDMEKCRKLVEKLPSNVTVFNNDGRNSDFLLQEGIEDTDAYISLMGNSEVNILTCLAAKQYGVWRTVAEVSNVDYVPMAESFDIGAIINKKQLAVNTIYRFLLNADVSTIKSLTVAGAIVAEMIVRDGAKATHKPVKELKLPSNLTLAGLIRNDQAMMIDGDTRIEVNDHVIVFCLDDSLKCTEKIFG